MALSYQLVIVLVALVAVNAASRPTGRRPLQTTAQSRAAGQGFASATSAASVINGESTARTDATATGPGAVTAGRSEADGKVDVCFSGPNYDVSQCRTLASSQRASGCTNVAPDDRWTCQQQAEEFDKCDESFIFKWSWCLESCGRCEDGCYDEYPEGESECREDRCESEQYTTRPVCLKTCGRCYAGEDDA